VPPIVAASATYSGLSCDETPFIDTVAKHVNLPVFRWDGTRADGTEFSEQLLAAPGNRMSTTGGTDGHVEIARSQGARVILDGTGGDQLGMPLGSESDEITRSDWLRLTPSVFRSGVAFSGQRPLVLRWAVGVAVPLSLRRFYGLARQRLSPQQVPDWLTSTVSFRAHQGGTVWKPQSFLSRGQKMRWRTLLGGPLASYIEQKQRHSSFVGLETAFPFLDWDLVQFILALPRRYWPQPRWLARLHREALQRDLPPAIYRRGTKAEFASAMVNRVRRSFPIISDLFDGETWAAGRFVDQNKVRGMLRAFRMEASPGFVAAYHLWAIASLEAWLRQLSGYGTVLRRGA
jgi:hypothetical protein